MRANGYSLVAVLGVSADDVSDAGPGSFSGPFVAGGHALVVWSSYLAAVLVVARWLLRHRDVVWRWRGVLSARSGQHVIVLSDR